MTQSSLIRAIVIALFLTAFVLVMLSFADSYAVDTVAKRCALGFAKSKWPMYIGCAMAAHEDLAAGLIGGAGALFAAWLAYLSVQDQFSIEENRRLRRQVEAKAVATMCIAPPVQAAASALAEVERARKAQGKTAMDEADGRLDVATGYVETALEDPAILQIAGDLDLDGRLIYQSIVGTLRTFVNISSRPSPALNRMQSLQNKRRALMNLHTYLIAFGDEELARMYVRDSGTQHE
jgi:hypothetical protein